MRRVKRGKDEDREDGGSPGFGLRGLGRNESCPPLSADGRREKNKLPSTYTGRHGLFMTQLGNNIFGMHYKLRKSR